MIEHQPEGERLQLAKDLFTRACEVPRRDQADWVRAHAIDDPSLADYVIDLLAHAGVPSDAIQAPAAHSTGSATKFPERVGPYQVLEVLGRGGQGVVYRAQQFEPLRRQVAVKVIRTGITTMEVLSRFHLERSALAAMNHRCIAKVFDAGETEQGEPWFAMELVRGNSLTGYCDQHRLSLADRLETFRLVCDGVQHAHSKGIIHRDLKPGNVLVSSESGQPEPKILDFGLAKATDREQLAATMATEADHIMGTMEYMSPEQAAGKADQLDARSDIYSLGVMLYELVTGDLPFPAQMLRQAGWSRAMDMIQNQDPPLPSARFASCEDRKGLADLRRTSASSLQRALASDLDWIVLKAMAKEPDRRYPTVAALGEDVRRFLTHEPVQAGPPSVGYRLRKFVRRYRLQVLAAAAVLLACFVGLALHVHGLRQSALLSAIGEARLAFTQSRWQLGLDAYDRALALGCESPNEVHCDRVECLEAMLRVDESLALLHHIPSGPPSRTEARRLLLLGSIGRDRGQDPENGVAELRAAWSMHEHALRQTGEGLLSPGDVGYLRAMLAEDLEAMITVLREGLQREPWHRMANEQLPVVLLFAGRLDEAALACRANLARWPGDESSRTMLAVAAGLCDTRTGAGGLDHPHRLHGHDPAGDPQIAAIAHAVGSAVRGFRSQCLERIEYEWRDTWKLQQDSLLKSMLRAFSKVTAFTWQLERDARALTGWVTRGQLLIRLPPVLARAYHPLFTSLRDLPRYFRDLCGSAAHGQDRLAGLLPGVSDSFLFLLRSDLSRLEKAHDAKALWLRCSEDLANAELAIGPLGSTAEAQRLARLLRIRALHSLSHYADGNLRTRIQQQVIETARRALAGTSMHPAEALVFASIVNTQCGEKKLSIGILDRSWRENPDDVQTMVTRGCFAKATGDITGAARWFRMALARNPEHGEAKHELAQLSSLPTDASATRTEKPK